MDWAPADDAHWHIELRCGDCGHLERMAAEVETFAAALSRDLIEPADFAV